MSTHPILPLFIDDYDAATAHLTAEEDGVYMRLLRLCWRTPGCSLPNEPGWIARKIRLSPTDYERVAKPVIEEFFTLSRGRLVQRRLRAEYDDISRKKSARQNAGKKGGDAKAAKNKENVSSNATDLPRDTRAFPYPYPNIESPLAPKGAEPPDKPIVVRASDVEAIWAITPSESRRRSGKADLERSLKAAAKRGRPPESIRAGLIAYFASPEATKDGGQFVKGVHRMVEADRWQAFVEVAPDPGEPDPELLRRAWAIRLDRHRRDGTWLDAWGPKPGEPKCQVPADLMPTPQADLLTMQERGAA